MPAASNRVFVVGLDGAEPDLIEPWIARGHLPNLAALKARGCWGRLRSTADCFAPSVWPCFTYGTNPARSNIFSSFPLTAGGSNVRALSAKRIPDRPFMAYARGMKSVLVDIPKSAPDPALNGVQVISWGAHAPEHAATTVPSDLMGEIRRHIGAYPLDLHESDDTAQGDRYYHWLRERLMLGIEVRQRLVAHLLDRERDWDLFVGVWREPHAAGHRFWHFMDASHPWHRADAPEELRATVRDVYAACDRMLGWLMGTLPPETTLLVVSVHGMQPNNNAQEVTARLLERWFDAPASSRASLGPGALLERTGTRAVAELRRAVPQPIRDTVKQWLPERLRAGTRTQLMKSVYHSDRWARMAAFCLPTDDSGYVRVNLKGRDVPGLVEPGAEYERLLDDITRELEAARNLDADVPIVAKISRPQRLFDGPYRELLPDLALAWNTALPVRGLRSERFGVVMDTRRLPQHRSGIHSANGFIAASGPGVTERVVLSDGHILDLAPTVLALLGHGAPDHLDGRVLEGLIASEPVARTA
jgi:predicted AlkP superfamily phosphohydrolase/phosphomutase